MLYYPTCYPKEHTESKVSLILFTGNLRELHEQPNRRRDEQDEVCYAAKYFNELGKRVELELELCVLRVRAEHEFDAPVEALRATATMYLSTPSYTLLPDTTKQSVCVPPSRAMHSS